MQPSQIGSETAQLHTHTCSQTIFFNQILFTCYSTRFFMSLLFLPVLVFNFLALVTQHKQTQMYPTKRSFQCIKSEIQSLVAMCAPCPLPRLNICLSVIPWWVVAHKKTGQSLYPCPPLSSPSLLSQRINTEDKLTKQLVGACIIMHVRVSVVMCGPQCWLETARHYFWSKRRLIETKTLLTEGSRQPIQKHGELVCVFRTL